MRTLHIDIGAKAGHGEALSAIYDVLMDLLPMADVLVREKGFSRFPRETQALFKVMGVCDLAAWMSGKRVFEELAPTTIKKLLTGNGKASKQDVAEALIQHVGAVEYACDDESDAVSAGIAWKLIHDRDELG